MDLPSPLQPPTLRDDLPRYPPLVQLLRVTTATVVGPGGFAQPAGSSFLGPTLYVSFLCQMRDDGSLLPRDREPVLVDDVNGAGLTPGYYLGRLAGSWTSLPVYEVSAFAVTNTTTVYNVGVTFNSNTTFNSTVTYSSTSSVTYNSTTITYNTVTETYNSSTVTYSSSTINYTNNTLINFGTTVSISVAPPGVLSKPTLKVTGAPTWVPAANTYPLVWGAYDHIDWEYDGLLRTPGGSSAQPGDTGWIPFVSVGRTPVADASYTCITIDRLIAYTSITAAHIVTLPPAGSLPPGFTLHIQDESGSASATNTISVAPYGSDQVNRSGANLVAVNLARGGAEAETDGVSNWTVRQYPAAGGGTTGTNGWVSQGPSGDYSCTASYVNVTGVSLTLPNTGTYYIWANVTGDLNSATVGDQIRAQLAIAGSVVSGTTKAIVWLITANTEQWDSCSIATITTATAGQVLTLQAEYAVVGGVTTALIKGQTEMGFIQLA